jgi:plasmid stabilization system protein ParE
VIGVRWTKPASADVESIFAFVAEYDIAAARRLVTRLRTRTESLASSPQQGRASRVDGLRELTVAGTEYLVLYRSAGATIQILRVLHTRRQWPPKL